MDDLVKAVDREEYARKENKLKVGQAGGDAAVRWLESRKLRWVSPSLFPSLFSFSPFFSSPPFSHFRGVNSTYAGASVICEFLYGLNIFVQWWMVDAFLGRCSSFPEFHFSFLCYIIATSLAFQIFTLCSFATPSLCTGHPLATGKTGTLAR